MLRNPDNASASCFALGGTRGFAILARQDLTAREREVWALLAGGCTDAEIAERLMVNSLTARVHVSNLFVKLGVTDRQEAARQARLLGLVTDPAGH